MRIKTFIITGLIIFIISSEVYSQRFEAGFKVINELFLDHYGPGFGGTILLKWSRHSGIESGIYYKINPRTNHDWNFYVPDPVVKEKTIMIPVMYRFNSNSINIGAGGTTSYILNYTEIHRTRPHETGKLEFAAVLSISKSYPLGKIWIIEPEIRGSATIPEGGVATSLNFSIRKKI